MKVQLESTDRIVHVNGVPARIWEGATAGGVPMYALVTRVAVADDQVAAEFERELQECRPLSAALASVYPAGAELLLEGPVVELDWDAVRPEVKAAVDWWAATFQWVHGGDNGDATTFALVAMTRDLKPVPTDEQLARYRELLAWTIEQQLLRNPKKWDAGDPKFASCTEPRVLSVDYGACESLRFAAQYAGIQRDHPIKTVMRLSPGLVTVRCGYGAREETIYPPEVVAAAESSDAGEASS